MPVMGSGADEEAAPAVTVTVVDALLPLGSETVSVCVPVVRFEGTVNVALALPLAPVDKVPRVADVE